MQPQNTASFDSIIPTFSSISERWTEITPSARLALLHLDQLSPTMKFLFPIRFRPLPSVTLLRNYIGNKHYNHSLHYASSILLLLLIACVCQSAMASHSGAERCIGICHSNGKVRPRHR